MAKTFVPGDIKTLTDNIQTLISDEPLRNELGRNVQQFVKTNFDWENIINLYEEKCFSPHRLL